MGEEICESAKRGGKKEGKKEGKLLRGKISGHFDGRYTKTWGLGSTNTPNHETSLQGKVEGTKKPLSRQKGRPASQRWEPQNPVEECWRRA